MRYVEVPALRHDQIQCALPWRLRLQGAMARLLVHAASPALSHGTSLGSFSGARVQRRCFPARPPVRGLEAGCVVSPSDVVSPALVRFLPCLLGLLSWETGLDAIELDRLAGRSFPWCSLPPWASETDPPRDSW